MKGRACGTLFLVLILGFFLAGCGCFIQAQKGEAPPPKPPEAQKMMPPEEKKEVPMPPAPPPPDPACPVEMDETASAATSPARSPPPTQ